MSRTFAKLGGAASKLGRAGSPVSLAVALTVCVVAVVGGAVVAFFGGDAVLGAGLAGTAVLITALAAHLEVKLRALTAQVKSARADLTALQKVQTEVIKTNEAIAAELRSLTAHVKKQEIETGLAALNRYAAISRQPAQPGDA